MINIRILIDFDNTCVKSDAAMIYFYNEVTGNNVEFKPELSTWNLELLIKDWTKQQVNDIFIQEGFFKHLELYDGVIETLNKLKADGHTIEIVSCHDIRGIHYKCEWIRKNLPMVDRINIIPLGTDLKLDKSHVQGDVIIDDVPSILENSPCKYKILYGDYSWQNKCEDFARAMNWDDILTFINIIEVYENNIK